MIVVERVLAEVYDLELRAVASDGDDEVRYQLARMRARCGALYVHVEARLPAYRLVRNLLRTAQAAWQSRCWQCIHRMRREAMESPFDETCRLLTPSEMDFDSPCASFQAEN